jgi:5'-nucleotidase
MSDRREFLKMALAGSAGMLALNNRALAMLAAKELVKITILHTNDVHSHIHPLPLSDPKYPGQGGVSRRAALIQKIRNEEKNVLLLDSGDFFQGTPYFNYFGGELELKLMSEMGYHATTLGNHDFDNGLEGLEKQLVHAQFPIICSNYDFEDTPLKNKTLPYKTFEMDGVKIGIFGLGIELEGLVMKKNFGNTRYLDPIATAARYTRFLRYDLGCHLIICLSHLGYKYPSRKISDTDMAELSRGVDVILGGHTHTLLEKPMRIKNRIKEEVLVAQTGWAGVRLGRIDFFIEVKSNKKISSGSAIKISE